MDRKSAQHSIDHQIAGLAERQHGVVAGSQLEASGVGAGALAWRMRMGRLHRVHQGVFAVGHSVLSRKGQLMAGVLAGGSGAIASHRCAGELWGMLPTGALVEITTANGRGRSRPGLIVHRGTVHAADRTVVDGIPVTAPGRTLVDLADVLTARALQRALDEAEYLRLDCAGLEPIPGRGGFWNLTRILQAHVPGSTRTRSELEELFLVVCERHCLTAPEVNVHVEGHEVDFLWRDERLIVEVDGRAAHATRRAFESDRARDAAMVAAGYRVVRATHARLTREPGAIADQLKRAGAPVARDPRSRSRAAHRRRQRP